MKNVIVLALLAVGGFAAPSAFHADSRENENSRGGSAVASQSAPSLNHVYIVLDQSTFDAIRDSRKLARLFGRTDAGLPDYESPPPEADRIFFRGRRTYLELFAPNNRFDEPVGKVGLALGHDHAKDFEGLAANWKDACGSRFRRTSIEYRRQQPPVPWYEAIQCDDTAGGPNLAVWSMVYRPEFHEWQSGSTGSSPGRIARADILEPRRADGQGRFDITGLSLKVSAAIYPSLSRQLERAGMVRDGAQFLGDGWKIKLEVDGGPRLVDINFDTDASRVRGERLGKAVLTRDGNRAARLTVREWGRPGQ
ncbi:MAG TPA: DUF5829 family protein [Sphingopyxis sp.]|nr:DUF5829 family protein [Sphingopyxis sp.]